MATIYARQSKDRKGDEAAVDRQVEECRALAKRHELTVELELIENDTSASKGSRAGFAQLLESIRQGRTDTVIVWATDRLYRRLTDLVALVELAERHRLTILTVKSGDLDLSTPAGRMLAGMLGSAARFEVEQKGVRQVAANVQRAKRGEWQFSRRPFGYRREGGVVVQVPEEVEVIREGYRRSLAGESGYAIVTDWNARGVLAPGGKAWTITQLRERLANPHYAGLIVHYGEVLAGVTATHEPIVSVEDYETFVQGVKARAARRTHDNRVRYLLSGLARCGVCGAALFARPEYRRKGGTTMTYQCTTGWCVSRALEPVDALVNATVVARLSDPALRAELAAMSAVDVSPLVEQATVLRERRDDLATLLGEGVLTTAAVREQSGVLTARIDELQQQIEASYADPLVAAMVSIEDVGAWWAGLGLLERRELIRALYTVTVSRQANPRVFDPEAIDVARAGR